MAAKFDILQTSVRAKFHVQIDLIPTRRVIAVDSHRRVRQPSKIPRVSRMIQNDFLIKCFQFVIHEKNRTAARRISIMRSISAVLL